jgi:FAD dependent monooxygenase
MSENRVTRFKAIIVGGSVAGLTLAHTFDSAGIDYVLLEGRENVAPAAGATIVIMPNGARVLDQLGIYEQMKDIFQPMFTSTIWKSDGRFMSSVEFPRIIRER